MATYTRRISLEGPGNENVPIGGAAGEALVKASNADRDVKWAEVGALHIGVTAEAESSTTTYTCDKTAAEIYAAYKAGRVLYFDVAGSTVGDDDENTSVYIIDRATFTVTDGVIGCEFGATSYITDWANEVGIFSADAGEEYPEATVTAG